MLSIRIILEIFNIIHLVQNPRKGVYMDWLKRLSLALIIIGALNWLLIGFFEWDLVAAIFGGNALRQSSALSRVIYSLVGLAGIYAISFFFSKNALVKDKH